MRRTTRAVASRFSVPLSMAMRAAPSEAQRNILDVERTLFMDDWTGVRAKLDRSYNFV